MSERVTLNFLSSSGFPVKAANNPAKTAVGLTYRDEDAMTEFGRPLENPW